MMKSIVEDMARYVAENETRIRLGVNLFAHQHPPDKTTSQSYVLFIEGYQGHTHRVMATGQTTCQTEFFEAVTRAATEEESRDLLETVMRRIDALHEYKTAEAVYMSVYANMPVHYVGIVKEKFYCHHIVFSVLRRVREMDEQGGCG